MHFLFYDLEVLLSAFLTIDALSARVLSTPCQVCCPQRSCTVSITELWGRDAVMVQHPFSEQHGSGPG